MKTIKKRNIVCRSHFHEMSGLVARIDGNYVFIKISGEKKNEDTGEGELKLGEEW